MTIMNMYINSSWREHLQEAEYGMGDGVGWLGGIWGVTLSFISIVNYFLFRLRQETWGAAQIFQEGWKLKNIKNRLLKV